MVPTPALPQQSVLEILKSKPRVVSAEIIPPRNGAETQGLFAQVTELKKSGVDFIAVTKGAGGSLRGGTLPIAQQIKSEFGVCSLAHFTCRDFTKEEIENNLMDHHYFGVRNILALRGDPPDGQPDYFKPGENRHIYAWQLVEQIRNLNNGNYLIRPAFDDPAKPRTGQTTRFCIGVAAHPEFAPHATGVDHFQKKVEMGAEFGITQMIFSADPYLRFIDSIRKRGLQTPVLPGLRILTSATVAEKMRTKFTDVHIPDALIEQLKAAGSKEKCREVGLEWASKLSEKLLQAGAPGIHIFVMSDVTTARDLISRVSK